MSLFRVRPIFVFALCAAVVLGIVFACLRGGEERAVRSCLAAAAEAAQKNGEESIFEASQKSRALADCLAPRVRVRFESGNEHVYSWADHAACAREILRARGVESSIRLAEFEVLDVNATGAGLVYARCRASGRATGAVDASFHGEIRLQLSRRKGHFEIENVSLRSLP